MPQPFAIPAPNFFPSYPRKKASLKQIGFPIYNARYPSFPLAKIASNLTSIEVNAKEKVVSGKNELRKNLLEGSSYKSRNVYKSIVHYMSSYTKKNREEILRILCEKGFTSQQIEHAFFKIGEYCDLELNKKAKKTSQTTIRKILSKKTILTYILRETLNAMLKNWDEGKYGKISKKNIEVYKVACGKFYNETVGILGEVAQGNSKII